MIRGNTHQYKWFVEALPQKKKKKVIAITFPLWENNSFKKKSSYFPVL
jgi:hypothetical protein